MTILTKEDIVEGIKKRIKIKLAEYGDKEIVIRPLSDGELCSILAKINTSDLLNMEENADAKDNVDLMNADLSNEILKNREFVLMVTEMGLVEPKLSRDTLESMLFGVPEKIGAKILEVSSFLPVEELKKKSKK